MALGNQKERVVTALDDKKMTPLPFVWCSAGFPLVNKPIITVRNRKRVEVLNNTVENLGINSLKSIHILVPLRNSLYITSCLVNEGLYKQRSNEYLNRRTNCRAFHVASSGDRITF